MNDKEKYEAVELTDEDLDKVSGGLSSDSASSETYWDRDYIFYINYATKVAIVKKQATGEIRTYTLEEYNTIKSQNSPFW